MTDHRPDDRDDFVISRDHHANEKNDALDQEIYYENTTRAFERKSRLPFIVGAASLILIVLLFIIFCGFIFFFFSSQRIEKPLLVLEKDLKEEISKWTQDIVEVYKERKIGRKNFLSSSWKIKTF